jgi:hypothetical protein
MITSETPYKLAEIIRDTWPQLHTYNSLKNRSIKNKKEVNSGKNNTTD